MLIIIILIAIVLASIILEIVYQKLDEPDWCESKNTVRLPDWVNPVSIFCIVLFGSVLVACSFDLAIDWSFSYRNEYSIALIKYENVQYALSENDDAKVYTLQADINDLNEKIYYSKNFKDNPWIGIFVNPYYADLDYITISK